MSVRPRSLRRPNISWTFGPAQVGVDEDDLATALGEGDREVRRDHGLALARARSS